MTFVAISKVKFPAELNRQIRAVGLEMLPIARLQPGFISVALHELIGGNETMMYWEWESQSDHEACMQSTAWLSLMERNKALFEIADVVFSIKTYKKLA